MRNENNSAAEKLPTGQKKLDSHFEADRRNQERPEGSDRRRFLRPTASLRVRLIVMAFIAFCVLAAVIIRFF